MKANNTKRTINGQQFNVPQIVDEALTAVNSVTLTSQRGPSGVETLGQ